MACTKKPAITGVARATRIRKTTRVPGCWAPAASAPGYFSRKNWGW
ncbi:hypothetical protein BVRB_3g064830 [Beta vulgaris subsp. vulgaris]|nr:hypothetical protein BVRB_3g064830 [Beta vulgaris subsp. vulgaris]